VCDCGCGNLDPECVQSSCADAGCYATGCDVCHDAAGEAAACAPPAAGWHCAPSQRDDGVCDCGCGDGDPDCERDGCSEPGCGAAECALCHDAFGRVQPCPGTWSCAPARFADGFACDCGCGRADPDCGDAGCSEPGCDADGCALRWGEHGVAQRPRSFRCDADVFGAGDGVCDCGCGALDPDCAGGCAEPGCRAPGCTRCRSEDGAAFECRWSCELERFGAGDGVCDCGCGALDPDCAAGLGCSEPGCFADGCTSCFDSAGAGYTCARGACPAGYENDGVCDCGCRQEDPDCSRVRDCLEPGCSAAGCGRCHDARGAVQTCEHFVCELERQGGGDGCNCGCGAPDPDCSAGEGCGPAGCSALGCDTCRSPAGAPMSCGP
jgi:hypothetical protein